MGVLEKLNTYGMEKIEDAVLAGLVTGDPVLLIGSHGSAKTLLARRLGDLTWLYVLGEGEGKRYFKLDLPQPQYVYEMTADRKFSLEMVRCLGCCALAPVIKIGNRIHPKVKPRPDQPTKTES